VQLSILNRKIAICISGKYPPKELSNDSAAQNNLNVEIENMNSRQQSQEKELEQLPVMIH
jgi:hypothetical protein